MPQLELGELHRRGGVFGGVVASCASLGTGGGGWQAAGQRGSQSGARLGHFSEVTWIWRLRKRQVSARSELLAGAP